MLYLVGSRLFGCHRPNSDWDYIGENNQENLEFVQALEIPRVNEDKRVQFYGKGLDIVLFNPPDFQVRMKVRKYLLSLPNITTLPKDERNLILAAKIKEFEVDNGIRL